MKKYRVPISWTMTGSVVVEATTKTDAYEGALDEFYKMGSGFPADQKYIEDSCVVDGNEDNIEEI